MGTLKQGLAAVALVTSLGLVVPSTFGDSVSADVSSNGRRFVSTTFNCDLDGDGSYETEYKLVSTESSTMWQVEGSTTVVVQRLKDLQHSTYTVDHDPTGEAYDFFEPTGYWSPEPDARNYPQANHKGWKITNCTETVQYLYSPYATESFGHLNDVALVPDFVQSPDCPEDPDSIEGAREDLPECVTYLETDTWLYDVTLTGKPGAAAKSASADDDATSADRQVKAKKNGKHRGKGKRGR